MIEIYDTTLRDGTQSEGFTLSGIDKIRIAKRLDAIGTVRKRHAHGESCAFWASPPADCHWMRAPSANLAHRGTVQASIPSNSPSPAWHGRCFAFE